MAKQKAYKFRLYPNKTQQVLLNKTFGCVRFAWNQWVENFNKPKDSDKMFCTPKEFKENICMDGDAYLYGDNGSGDNLILKGSKHATDGEVHIDSALVFTGMSTENLTVSDSGEVGATEDAWIEHEINGTTYFSRNNCDHSRSN